MLAWRIPWTVDGVAKSQTRLSDFHTYTLRTQKWIHQKCLVLTWKHLQAEVENIYFCFIDYAKTFDCVDHNKLWKILKEKEIPNHLTCLLRNPYAGQEATVKARHGTTDWFQIGEEVSQGCILSPCLLIYMQSTSGKVPGWMKHKLELRLQGEISITLYMQMTPPLWQIAKRN